MGAVFLSLSPARHIWALFKPLQYAQFSWRFLSIIGLFISFLGGAILSLRSKKLNFFLLLLLSAGVVFFNKKYFYPKELKSNLKDEDFINEEQIKWYVSHSSFEYLPAGVVLKEIKQGLEATPLLITKETLPNKRFEILEGEAEIRVLKDKADLLSFNTFSDQKIVIRANIFSFPGWDFYLDDLKADFTDDNQLKLITFKVPKGEHQVLLRFSNTAIRKTANLISLISMILSFLFFVFSKSFLLTKKK